MKVIQQDVCLKIEEDRIIPKDQPILPTDIEERIQTDQVARQVKCPSQDKGSSTNDVTEVSKELLLCAASSVTADRLRELGVTCVVNVAPELPDTPLPPGVAYLRVPVNDSPSSNLAAHFDDVVDTIERVRAEGGRTLVHCLAGISRSPALCLAYLVKQRRMTLRKAFNYLRARRSLVRPNSGFFRQLIELETRELGSASVAMVHNIAAGMVIPDVYEPEYQNMLSYQKYYKRIFGRH